ncbi:MAG TPA: hypothetical protein VH142_26080, partial [Polyangiaceae bacterium]|nr:hypothetical protein [Polyangiaceae bacterium]
EYGFVTHAKYVTRVLAISKPYDLAPYRDRIEKGLARTKDKKIREQIAGAFGKKTKPPKPKTFDAARGFRFDVHRAALVKAALAALKGKKLPAPIEELRLTGMPEMIRLEGLVLEGEGDTIELMLKLPKDAIPGHSDDSADDEILSKFENVSWGDIYELPWCVLVHEQIAAAHEIASALKKQKIQFAEDCKISVGAYDSSWDDVDEFEKRSRDNVAALLEEEQAAFAAACFEDPKRQRWLLAR